MLTKAAQYAIRAAIYLAAKSDPEHKISAKNIAENLEVPLPFLAKLMQQLTRAKIVSSTKGPSGGFYLNEQNQRKTVWDIISCIDGEEKFNECFLGLEQCSNENPCSVHHLVAPFKSELTMEFRHKNMAEMALQINNSSDLFH